MENQFDHILEKEEIIIRSYKPNRRTFRNRHLLIYAIPIFWLFLPFFPISYFVFRAAFNKAMYVVTNKRILVRGGIIGTDYKFLEFESINATTVHVSFLDKISRTNTGSLEFGSPATPLGMTNQSGVRVNPFRFFHINNSYEEHKFIKEHISNSKQAK